MAGRYSNPIANYYDENGEPLAGGKLEFFESGTSTPQDTFSDDALTVANPNPVIADSAGRFGDIFLTGADYKVVLKKADDSVIWTADPVRSPTPKSTVVLDVSTTTQLSSADDGKFVAADATGGAFIGTLPAAADAGDGYEITVQKIDSSTNVVTVDASGAETINGQSDLKLTDQYASATFRCDGSTWYAYAITPTIDNRLLPPNFLEGFLSENSSVDPDHDITFNPGNARNDADSGNIILSSAITKRLDAAFAEGNNQGGIDTGSVAPDSRYYMFTIAKSDGTADCLFSTSSTIPTLPSGFTTKRLLGYIRTDAVANIVPDLLVEEPRDNERAEFRRRTTAASYPLAVSNEDIIGATPEDDAEFVFYYSNMSASNNGRHELQFGDVADFTTGMTYQGSTVDESGVTVDDWAVNGAISLGTVLAANDLNGIVIFKQIPNADAEILFGAGNRAWAISVMAQADGASTDRIYGNGFMATTKTIIDRARVSVTAGNLDGGERGFMGLR